MFTDILLFFELLFYVVQNVIYINPIVILFWTAFILFKLFLVNCNYRSNRIHSVGTVLFCLNCHIILYSNCLYFIQNIVQFVICVSASILFTKIAIIFCYSCHLILLQWISIFIFNFNKWPFDQYVMAMWHLHLTVQTKCNG